MDRQTIDTYDELAEEYDRETADFWERFPRGIIDKFIEKVQGKVLDVGSGPGRDGLILKERGISVTCLDASSAMVKLSAARGLTSVQGDFSELPFADGSFEGVWAYTSLLHVAKAEIGSPMGEIKRVLRLGGVFGLGLIEGDKELYRESSGVGKPRWFSFYTESEVEELLAAHGFRIDYFEQFSVNTKSYLNFIATRT